MQGQQSTIGSFSEAFDLNNGSTSSTIIDQPICWDNMQHSAENHLSDYIIPPGDIGLMYMDPVRQEQQNTSRWCFGEPSSIGMQNEADQEEQKTEHGWSSSMNLYLRNVSRLEQSHEQINHLSSEDINVNPMIMQSFNADGTRESLNLNADFMVCDSDTCPDKTCEFSGTENEETQPPSCADLSSLPSGSGGFLVQENDARLDCSLEGRRASCKRKSLEGNIGQSSASGSSSYLQNAETTPWPAVPANCNGSGLRISDLSEQVDPRINLGTRGAVSESLHNSNVAGIEESSQRNFRVRISSSSQPESSPFPLSPAGDSVGLPNVSSSQQSRLIPVDNPLGFRLAPRPGSTSPNNQPVVIHVPAVPRNVQPFRWNGVSVSRPGSSSSSIVSRNRDAPQEGSSSRRRGRNILQHPRFIPAGDLRNLSQNQTNRSLVGGSFSIPGNIASSSQTGSSSVVPVSAPSWVSHANPPRYPRRLSEYVRRSLFSPIGSAAGGQESNSNSVSPLHSGSPSHELLVAPGTGNQEHHQSNRRSALWMEREGDSMLAIPYSLRNLAASSEGRSGTLVSEVRNVLGLMRRGEGFRFEDVMLLDQSIFLGVADIHDRHRDMRLDVDNMSYEELLALEERIGNVSTGLSEETILKQLEQRRYSSTSSGGLEAEPCCVCQEEYKDGEDIGKLDCGHDFHRDCIKQWLMQKNLCPVCKTTGLAT